MDGRYLDGLVKFAAALEDAGYDHVVVYDHVVGADSTVRPGWSGAYDHRSEFFEPLTVLA